PLVSAIASLRTAWSCAGADRSVSPITRASPYPTTKDSPVSPPRSRHRMRPDHDIAGAEAAHRRLDATLAGLDDRDVRAPSLLPGWNVAMVLTHIARNADSFRRMIEGAQCGEVLDQYERGAAGREADIQAGRDRECSFVVDDVRVASRLLE